MNGDLFSPETLAFLAAALGRTLWMTFIGCTIGFVIGMGLAILRRTRAPLPAPLPAPASCVPRTARGIRRIRATSTS